MKKILFIVFASLLGLNAPAFAKDTSIINGNTHLNKEEYDSLKVNGNLTFKDLEIKNALSINGNIHGKNLKCKTIESKGSFDVDGLQAQSVESNGFFTGKNVDITGESKFNGALEIKNGKLHDIQIVSTRSTFVDTQINGNIHVKKVNKGRNFFGLKSNESSAQVLELKGNSLATGDIFFEEEGEVHLFDGAKVRGKVVNAKVIQK